MACSRIQVPPKFTRHTKKILLVLMSSNIKLCKTSSSKSFMEHTVGAIQHLLQNRPFHFRDFVSFLRGYSYPFRWFFPGKEFLKIWSNYYLSYKTFTRTDATKIGIKESGNSSLIRGITKFPCLNLLILLRYMSI